MSTSTAHPQTRPAAADPGRARRAAWAVVAVFALNGISFATWSSRIPALKVALGLSAGELGRVLFIGSLGALVGLPVAGRITERIGAARTVLLGVGSFVAGLVLAGAGIDLWHSVWAVTAGMFLIGIGNGLWDVAMNLEGASVEHLTGRAIMPRFHAAFSAGTVLSALLSALLIRLGVGVLAHFVAVAVLVPVLVWASLRGFLPRSLEHEDDAAADRPDDGATAGRARPGSPWTESRTLLIGVVVLVAALTEGTANDWVSVAFVEGHHLPQWAGVLAFATFLSAMTAGRVLGTHVLDRHGRVPVLRGLFLLAGLGSLLVVFGTPPVAFVGAVLWGLGASLGFPVGMSAASDDPRRAAARLSVVSTIGYTAFLAGPPALGFLGDHVGVLHSLLVVGALAPVALLLVPATRESGVRASAGA